MSTHADWTARGFTGTLPIIPPNAPLSERSQGLVKERGKAPGLRRKDGRWHGFVDWRSEAAPAPAEMDAWGAGVGLPAGRWPAVDIDVRNAKAAELLMHAVLDRVPGGALRVGQWPKVLLMYRAAPGQVLAKRKISFWLPGDDRTAPGARPHAVEILGEGQQYVVDGMHPKTGKAYTWPTGRPDDVVLVVLTPEQADAILEDVAALVDVLGGEVVSRAKGGDGTGADPEDLLAPDEALLAEAVGALVPDGSREWWIEAGMAIKGAGGTLDQWQAVSDRWDGPPEDPEDLERRWSGFRDLRVGWRWVERHARAAGWFGGVEHDFAGVEVPPAGTGRVEEAAPEPATIQEAMFARYVWIEDLERIGDTVDRSLLTRTQFNVRMAEIGPPHDTRRSGWAQFFEPRHGEVRCRRIKRCTYRPGQGAIVEERGEACFNTWQAPTLRPAASVTEADVAPWLALARRLLPGDTERGIALDWLASLLQRPGVKPAFVLVLGGHEGIGKDSLVAPVVRALGLHNVSNVTMQTVMGPNTHWVAQKQLVIITEMHSFSRREVMEKLKPIGACPPDELEVNIKYLPQYWVPNIIAGLYFTNHPDALALSDSDRRHFIAWSPHENPEVMAPAEKQAFEEWFTDVYYPWLAAGGAEKVAGWLLKRDLGTFLKMARAPWTEGKAMMRREGRSEAVAALEDALDAMDLPDLVNPEDLAARLNAGGRGQGRPVTGHAVARVLRSMGAKLITKDAVAVPRTALATEAKRVRIWALRNETVYLAERNGVLARRFAEMWGATKQDIQGFFSPQLAVDNSSVEGPTVEEGTPRVSLL